MASRAESTRGSSSLVGLLAPLRPGSVVVPGWRIVEATAEPPRIELSGPRNASLSVRLASRDGSPAYAETRSFAIYYVSADDRALGADAEAAVLAVARAIAANDERAWRAGRRLSTPGRRPVPRSARFDPTLDRQAYREALRRMLRENGRPERVVLTVESACDLHCAFCTRGTGGTIPNAGPLSPPDDLLFQVEVLATTGAAELNIGGDEPLAHPALTKVVRRALAAGFERVTVSTAGVRLADPAVARRAARAGVLGLLIPLYGSVATVHDAVTGVRGSFRRVLAGIRNARAAGLHVGLSTLALRANLRSLAGLEPLARRLGLEPPGVAQVMPRSAIVADHRRTAPTYTQVVAALRPTTLRPVLFPECIRRRIEPVAAAAGSPSPASAASPWPRPAWAVPFFPPKCGRCSARTGCPGTFAPYVQAHGDAELQPIRDLRAAARGRSGRGRRG